jgi:predicted O-methyltransferase YrrM
MAEDFLNEIPSAWKGHKQFAEWLVETMKPTTIVELGVDYGYSSFIFAMALEKHNPAGKIYGIDWFQGDKHAGERDTLKYVTERKEMHSLNLLEIIKGDFAEIAKAWSRPLDILHIDGYHTFEAVQNDFKNWSPFVKNDGVILFHDTAIGQFGIKDFFRTLNQGHRLHFLHSAGLGIFTKNTALFEAIKAKFSVGNDRVYDYYERPC